MDCEPITEETLKEHPELLIGPQSSIFDRPCPDAGNLDLSQSAEVQEWVFNHLPLSHQQKKEFLQILIKDSKVKEKKEKTKKILQSMKKKKKEKKFSDVTKKRQSVKAPS